MIRKLKIMGALVAVVAMSAMTTSAAQAQITSEKYPATITGSSTGDVFHAFGGTVKCINTGWTMLIGASSETVTIHPSLKQCTAWGLPATVNFTGCDYLWHKKFLNIGKTDVVCPAGQNIDIWVYSSSAHTTGLCHATIPAQTEKSGFTLSNTAGGTITVSGSIGGQTVEQNRTSIACPAGTSTSTATYTFQAEGMKLTGNNGAISVD